MAATESVQRTKLAVLISGEGSNLQALLDACASGTLPADVSTVISNRACARGLRRAATAQVPIHAILAASGTAREDYDATLRMLIERHAPELVLLAGFMRVLSDEFVRHFRGRLLNIHPALLPKFRGLHTHRRVLEAGEKEHGCSVHFVTEELDGGPIIARAKVAVKTSDTEQTLAARVRQREHALYPLVVRWLVEGRVKLNEDRVSFDGQPLASPRVFEIDEEIA
ncbi:MAG TPA: phosphoribosylglycinamide formyltransferase [Gammaproteobacteria bacterium]|nr:phosphoribosylglycinamide formyltransferase [Gammaproteobacteria bacterium]